jgi:hypothetical protein
MSYKGLMDGWHGDENECNGDCGLCDDCERRTDMKGDQEYECYRCEHTDKSYE